MLLFSYIMSSSTTTSSCCFPFLLLLLWLFIIKDALYYQKVHTMFSGDENDDGFVTERMSFPPHIILFYNYQNVFPFKKASSYDNFHCTFSSSHTVWLAWWRMMTWLTSLSSTTTRTLIFLRLASSYHHLFSLTLPPPHWSFFYARIEVLSC